MIEELHLSDETLRNNYMQNWESGNYSTCISILQNEQLTNKKMIAAIFNNITSGIVDLENNSDPTFKTDKIIVSSVAPSGLSSGSLWFEEIV